MKTFNKTILATAVTALMLSGCGGSGSSNGDEQVMSRGVITGFGSIYVNGRRFLTDDARFDVDDDSGDESDLRIGMVVTVVGYSDDDDDYADRVIYDNELKGPVSNIQIDLSDATRKTLTILGQSVLVDSNTTIDDDGNLSFDTIAVGDVLEVSGFSDGSGFIATHIELQDNGDEIEIKGEIENLSTDQFEIRGFTVSYDHTTEIDDDIAVLANGLYVEVEGRLDLAGTTLIAEEIEREDLDYMDDSDDVEIEGVISGYDAATRRFMLASQLVDASNAEIEPSGLVLGDGLFVEVEGYLAGGILFADEVELEDDD